MKVDDGTKFLVFDTETTGLPNHEDADITRQPHIIEFGAILCNRAGESLREYATLIKPEFYVHGELEARITRITGLTMYDLAGAPSFRDVLPEVRSLFAEADVVCGHNLAFDLKMIRFELIRMGSEGAIAWPARELCSLEHHLAEYGRWPRLAELQERYSETDAPYDQSHRALDDVRATVNVFLKSGMLALP